MGEVYGAYDAFVQRRVALKLVRVDAVGDTTARADAKERLLREARVIGGLRHPHIVELFDAGEVDGMPYLVLELCEGGSLRPIIAAGQSSPTDKLRWLTETARALAFAHGKGIAHRDIKPENILLTAEGIAKVGDFGIAKALGSGQGTETSSVIGTPRYMAPEQLMGIRVDGRADQFAWALVAEELLTGAHPRSAATRDAFHETSARVPPRVAKVLARALSTDAEARFASFDELLGELRTTSESLGVVVSRARPASRGWHPATVAAAAVASASLVVFLAFLSLHARASSQQPALSRSAPDATRDIAAEEVPVEARIALAAGLQLWSDASIETARQRLADVAKKFPMVAAAHVYNAAASEWVDADFRAHVREAETLRGSLSARDSALLHALEPLLKEPPDYAATSEALRQLSESYRDDSIVWRSRAAHGLRARQPREVLALVDKLEGPNALWVRARALFQIDRVEAAREALEMCARTEPRSIDCLDWLTRLELNEGRCDEAANIAKQMIASDPDVASGYGYLARAEIGKTHSTETARALIAERASHIPPESRDRVRLRDEFFLDVYDGRFDEARAAVDAWEKAVSNFPDAAARFYPFVCRIDLELELGETDKAAREARRFQAASEGWLRTDYVDIPTEVTRVLYLTGAIDRPALEARRRHDEATMRALGGYLASPGIQWFETYAQMTRTADDAREAIALLPAETPTVEAVYRDVGVDEEIGRNDLLADRPAEAIASLRRATKSCNYLKSIHSVRAQRFLGDALATTDRAGACAAYGRVLERWGRDMRSTTAKASRAASHRLGCSE